jgi:hypothetical protein
VPRLLDPQPSEKLSPSRRRLALGIAALALTPIAILVGCGNAGQQQANDPRPEPNASTEGVRKVYPTTPATEAPVVPPKSGVPSPELTPGP